MMKLNVGFNRKANDGSCTASVSLELELEAEQVNQPKELQDRIRQLFRLARASVDEELNGQFNKNNGNGRQDNSGPNRGGFHNGNRRPRRPSTVSQARAIRAIAGRQRVDLQQLLGDRYGVSRPEDLSISDASKVIDELKATTESTGG